MGLRNAHAPKLHFLDNHVFAQHVNKDVTSFGAYASGRLDMAYWK